MAATEKRCFYCNHVLNHTTTEMASERNDVPENEDFQIDYYVCPFCGKHYEVDFPTKDEGYTDTIYDGGKFVSEDVIDELKTVQRTLGEEARYALQGEALNTETDMQYFKEGKEALDKAMEELLK